MKNLHLLLFRVFILLFLGTLVSCNKDSKDNNSSPISCSIVSPQNGAKIFLGTDVLISVNVQSGEGSVKEVSYYINDIKDGQMNEFPYSYLWNTSIVDTGNYVIKAVASDNNGNAATGTVQVTIIHEPATGIPMADFYAQLTEAYVMQDIQFIDMTKNGPSNWLWSFGDGSTSVVKNPIKTFDTPGVYSISLLVSNSYGADTEIKDSYIKVNPAGAAPITDFKAIARMGEAPFNVSFIDESANIPDTWHWDFGDGSTSTEEYPSHTYSSNGYYTVSLTTSNYYGSDTEVKDDYIYVGESGIGQPCPGAESFTYHGKVYNTTLIGYQCWMKENLNYQVGTSYCYNNSAANCDKYGRLYTWGTIMSGHPSSNIVPSGVQGICPDGWHVPSHDEWKILEGTVDSQYGVGDPVWDEFGKRGYDVGKKLKSTYDWYNNGNGTDDYGFGFLPGGWTWGYNDYMHINELGRLWTSTEDGSDGIIRSLYYENNKIMVALQPDYYANYLRCVKD